MSQIEDVINFWNARPCNIRHSNKPVGTMEYFNEVSEKRYFVEPHIKKFVDFEKWDGKRVLEIGCGIGTDAYEFAISGATYTGSDISSASIELAKKRFSMFNLSGTFLESDAESLTDVIESQKFDLIYSFGVIHHTPSIERALSEISRIADENTEIKIMIYAEKSWKQALINAGLDQPEAQFGCPIANAYTKEKAISLFNDAGLNVVNIEQDHIFPFIIDEYKKHNYKLQPYFEAMPSEIYAALKKEFGWHLLIDAKKQ
jgi:ubiquinone/menaquinone biosynthesis C-methylase UbiE